MVNPSRTAPKCSCDDTGNPMETKKSIKALTISRHLLDKRMSPPQKLREPRRSTINEAE